MLHKSQKIELSNYAKIKRSIWKRCSSNAPSVLMQFDKLMILKVWLLLVSLA